jgi:hypothetical protein
MEESHKIYSQGTVTREENYITGTTNIVKEWEAQKKKTYYKKDEKEERGSFNKNTELKFYIWQKVLYVDRN